MAHPKSRPIALLVVLLAVVSACAVGQEIGKSPTVPPKYCKPCLFYAGDFDGNNSAANGVYNDDNSQAQGAVYVPFRVPKGQNWSVTGLAVNLLSTSTAIPSSSTWEIRKGVSQGNGGKVIASGKGSSVSAGQFDCGGIAVYCFTLLTKRVRASLPSGRYWLSMVPQCNGMGCDAEEIFLADVEDNPPPNHYGPLEPWDDSFFNSNTFGYPFAPTWGSSGTCGGKGCDRFSAAILGKSTGTASLFTPLSR
jgi:hypothetical protein